jgi:secreted trypsin-like serine protease
MLRRTLDGVVVLLAPLLLRKSVGPFLVIQRLHTYDVRSTQIILDSFTFVVIMLHTPVLTLVEVISYIFTIIMNRLLKKKISLVAAVAVVTGPTMVGARARRQRQRQRGGGGRGNFFPHHPHQHQSDDRALRADGDANATAAIDAVPEVASIVNGTATGGPRSYMVGLTRKRYNLPKDDSPFYYTDCGGTLIGPTIVLTAAHCMKSLDPVDQVLVNLYDRYDPAGVVAINIQDPSEGADIVVHPGWDEAKTVENDIALMFLPIGQVVDYAQINDDPHEPVEDDPLRVMGWGYTENGSTQSDVLLETTVDYISNEECKEALADFTAFFPKYVITEGMMCGYQKYTGSCSGDSGGPLFHVDADGEIGDQPTQLGIVSWGDPFCVTSGFGYPGVYTRVSYYAEWIKETVCSRSEHATKELCGLSKSGKR